MIRVRQIKVKLTKNTKEEIKKRIAFKLKINFEDITDVLITKQSLDARKKADLTYVYEADITAQNEKDILFKNKSNDVLPTLNEKYEFKISGDKKLEKRPIIIGSGPAGLFAAYLLSENGYNPLIIERGEPVEDRIKTVNKFWETGVLDLESNVQFGEGGAGTFSDGKLNTLVKDKNFRGKKVFEVFVNSGAPAEIMYLNKPHIGTDLLRDVVRNIRNKIIEFGGEFRYKTCLTDLVIQDGKVAAIKVNNDEIIETDVLVLAIGHSARDTFEMLYKKGLNMKAKPFAVGVRISHPQAMINKSQYGNNDYDLPPASYKLTYRAKNKRGVYSFCMCPGGEVVNASSETKRLVVNGMSNYKRDTVNANSALVVTVSPEDFGHHPLSGIKYQRMLEEKAYAKGYGKIPVQLLGDFISGTVSSEFGSVKPIFKGEYAFADINEILPDYICESLKEAMNNFNSKINGYAREDAILAGVESRTSSPVKIERDEEYVSNIKGLYPCGEGAGYAGGITTSAMDGIKVAEAIAAVYTN